MEKSAGSASGLESYVPYTAVPFASSSAVCQLEPAARRTRNHWSSIKCIVPRLSGGGGSPGLAQSNVLTNPSIVTDPSEVNWSSAAGPVATSGSGMELPCRLCNRCADVLSPS